MSPIARATKHSLYMYQIMIAKSGMEGETVIHITVKDVSDTCEITTAAWI